MKCRHLLRAVVCAVVLASGAGIHAEDHPMLDKFAHRLDAIEKKFWRIAPLPDDHRSRPDFSAELLELENMARTLRRNCISYNCGKIPDLYEDALMLSRAYDQFRVNSKSKSRSLTVSGTGIKEYQRRHNKLMREKLKEAEEETGKKLRKRSSKTRPKLSEFDCDDYSSFLDDVSDKNSRKFSNWANGLKSREKIKTAEQIFSVWQKSICNMRMKLVLLAQRGKLK
ncbi:MAG: hypothetical protein IJW08_02855 [Lentisphaeria bacterium]|nr:hypothetical protein [Lentisphaeria bacterium]